MSQGPQLKRSQKTDFAMLTRERSFVRPNKDPQKRRSHTMTVKPTMEIYRPPNIRSEVKLNVHAKEFTMNHDLQPSHSNLTLGMPLQHSKSSGNVLRHVNHPGFVSFLPTAVPLPLLHSSSTSQMMNHHHQIPRGTFQQYAPVFPTWNHFQPQPLTRSKSLTATDSTNLMTKLKGIVKEDIDFEAFPEEARHNLKTAIEDPNSLPSRTLMDLVKIILEKAVEGIKYSESVAKLCVAIIEQEHQQTFLESLLNSCQQWYQERERILRGVKAGDGTRFTAFMWFLTELYGQLKRRHFETLQADLTVLSILSKCCQTCVGLPIKCVSETECLFFVLTSIGRDLETELPQQLEQLLGNVRDGFLASAGSSAVRRTLLQLIELHASNWQLPGSSVLYYYPRVK